MSSRGYSRAVAIAAGDAVSETANISGLSAIGILAPVVTSCQVFLQVAAGETQPSSASFVRVSGLTINSGQLLPWVWNVGQGSAAATLSLHDAPWSWARVECGVTQAGGATFTIVGKPGPAS